uniref:GOLGA2L5 domain-containing protein n=1 Tax=Caenorhabditis tropicalis TaxID=1561998 RepID=A0A1I7U6Y6_9PELO
MIVLLCAISGLEFKFLERHAHGNSKTAEGWQIDLAQKFQNSEAQVSKLQKAMDSQKTETSQKISDAEAQNHQLEANIEALKLKINQEASELKKKLQNLEASLLPFFFNSILLL